MTKPCFLYLHNFGS